MLDSQDYFFLNSKVNFSIDWFYVLNEVLFKNQLSQNPKHLFVKITLYSHNKFKEIVFWLLFIYQIKRNLNSKFLNLINEVKF